MKMGQLLGVALFAEEDAELDRIFAPDGDRKRRTPPSGGVS